MIILHATFIEGEFLVWGETPEEPETSAVKKPRNKSNLRGGSVNPKLLRYDAGIEKLSSVLNSYSINNSTDIAKAIINEAKFWYSRLTS